MLEREKRIAQYRQCQPLAELQRKRNKAKSRHGWTQEDLDYIKKIADRLDAKLKRINLQPPLWTI